MVLTDLLTNLDMSSSFVIGQISAQYLTPRLQILAVSGIAPAATLYIFALQ